MSKKIISVREKQVQFSSEVDELESQKEVMRKQKEVLAILQKGCGLVPREYALQCCREAQDKVREYFEPGTVLYNKLMAKCVVQESINDLITAEDHKVLREVAYKLDNTDDKYCAYTLVESC